MRVTGAMLRRRLIVILGCLSIALLLLIGRLAYIQIVQSHWLTVRAEDLWRRNIPVEAKRGTIFDANGEVLAYSASAATVVAVPAQIKDKPLTAQKLANVLGVPTDGVLKRISKKTLLVYITKGGRRLDDTMAKKVRDLHLTGIYITEEGKRFYPDGNLAAHVLGFVGADNQGLTGIETKYDNRLAGDAGRISFFANARGEEMPGEPDEYVAPQPGEDAVLTIDARIQKLAEQELEKVKAEYSPDGATIIVANPKTGAIVAMADDPTYDPAHYRNYDPSVYNHNMAIWKTFEPGSTFKIVTLSAALQEGKVNLKDRFYDPGYYEVAGHRIRCWKAGGHGSQTFLNVVENSCNPGFIALGERLGKTTLFDYIKRFGFGQKTGIDIPGEATGILFKPSQVGPLELATTAFGQGVSVTPIQQVMAMSAIANGGLLMKPYLVQEWKNHDTGSIIGSPTQPTEVRRVVSQETASAVREALESVVAQGTGRKGYRYGYRIAGKTGTAQVVENGGYSGQHYIVSFIGMAPANDPKLVAYVAIDYPRPKGIPVFGGQIAAPVIGDLVRDSLETLGVQPTPEGVARKYNYGDIVPETVPKLTGQTYVEAKKQMLASNANLKVAVSGNGTYVVAQDPAAGTQVAPASTVRIYLSDQSTP